MKNDKIKRTYDSVQQEKEAIRNFDKELQQARNQEDQEMGWSDNDGSDSGWEHESDEGQDQIASETQKLA